MNNSLESPWRGSRRELLKTAAVKTAAVGAASLMGGSLLAGCATPNAMPGKRVTLTQWYHQYGEKGTEQAVQRYADEYMRQNPDIGVQVVWVPGDYQTKLSTALLTHGGPDIFEGQLTAARVTANQVASVDDLFTPETRADFFPRALAENTLNGKMYGVKMLTDTGILYYRKSLLQATGLKPPETLPELVAVAKALTTPTRKGLFLGNDGGIGALMTILPWSAGSDFLVDNKIVFNTPRTAAAYEALRGLGDSGTLLIGAPTDYWDPSALTQGLVAMQWGGMWSYPAIHKALGDDVGSLTWPALDAAGRPATFQGGWSALINAQSAHVDEAKKYVRWLWVENKKLQEDWCLSYGFHVPARVSVAQSAVALDASVPAQAVKDLDAHGHIMPATWTSGMNTALTDAVTSIVKQGQPAAPALAQAAYKCNRELSRLLE